MNESHWNYPYKINPTDWFGFVYIITNRIGGQKYIGQKKFFGYRNKPPLKGRKNRRKTTFESDWRTYTGSSTKLNDHIEMFGKENFQFDIVGLLKSKSALNYREVELIMSHDALRSDEYYNGLLPAVKCAPKYYDADEIWSFLV